MARNRTSSSCCRHRSARPSLLSRRIGIHTSTAGGVENAAERAYRLGCNTFQIFSSSPRQWKPYELARPQCEEMTRLREQLRSEAAGDPRQLSGESGRRQCRFSANRLQPFAARWNARWRLCADFLVLHPGSFRGSRPRGRPAARRRSPSSRPCDGLDLATGKLRILIENTAGAEFSLGGNFEQVAELLYLLGGFVPVGRLHRHLPHARRGLRHRERRRTRRNACTISTRPSG